MIKIDNLECEITLLSEKEYKKIKNKIPFVGCNWWLRTYGNYCESDVSYVREDVYDYYGTDVRHSDFGVRPVLKSNIFNNEELIGEEIVAFGHRWTVCGEGFAIATTCIGYHRFDSKSRNYETSEVKQFIRDWRNKYLEMKKV